jgi:hypothetical protein
MVPSSVAFIASYAFAHAPNERCRASDSILEAVRSACLSIRHALRCNDSPVGCFVLCKERFAQCSGIGSVSFWAASVLLRIAESAFAPSRFKSTCIRS